MLRRGRKARVLFELLRFEAICNGLHDDSNGVSRDMDSHLSRKRLAPAGFRGEGAKGNIKPNSEAMKSFKFDREAHISGMNPIDLYPVASSLFSRNITCLV